MKNRSSWFKGGPTALLLALLLLVILTGKAFALESFYSPTELKYHDKDKAFQGYTIFTPLAWQPGATEKFTYLIDMNGQVVHKWKFGADFDVSYYGIVQDDGNFYRALSPHNGADGTPPAVWLGIHPTGHSLIVEDWNGNKLHEVRTPHKDMTRDDALKVLGLAKNTSAKELAHEINRINNSRKKEDIEKKMQMLAKYDYIEHHDVERIWNTKLNRWTVLFIALKRVTPDQLFKAGAMKEQPLPEGGGLSTNGGSFPEAVTIDAIVEVDLETGKKVWEWWFWDHMIQNHDPKGNNWYQTIADKYYGGDVEEAFYRRLDINTKSNQGVTGPEFDWSHVNSLDYNADRDEIVFNSRHLSEFFVIDHSISEAEAKGPKGDFLYRFGSPSNYASANQLGEKGKACCPTAYSAGYAQIWGAHDIQWIDKGLPGAGHFLIFDNGIGRIGTGTFSAVLEINPYDANGNYVKELDAGYRKPPGYPKGNFAQIELVGMALLGRVPHNVSNQIVWGFSGNSGQNFYSPHISGAQRQPNGNTLICSGQHGHIFEVTEDGEVVWEYNSPMNNGRVVTMGSHAEGKAIIGGDDFGGMNVFRAYRFGVDDKRWSGRELTPQGTISGKAATASSMVAEEEEEDQPDMGSVGGY